MGVSHETKAGLQELRKAPRVATERPGWVITDDGKTEPCIVSNISSAGAKVTLLSRQVLPPEFTLSLSGQKHRSRLAWRTVFHAGVEFLPSFATA